MTDERIEALFREADERFEKRFQQTEMLFRETWNQMKALSSTLNARIDGVANELAGVKSELGEVKRDVQDVRTATKDVVFELVMKVELRGTRLALAALDAELAGSTS